jgi:ubiquinone/menaquinone biosynthesis C-methylase UbiE
MSSEQHPAEKIKEISFAYWKSQVLFAAVRLNLFQHLGEAVASAEELARMTGADPSALTRLLDALVALGLLRKSGGGFAVLPDFKAYLTPGGEMDITPSIAHMEHLTTTWSQLDRSVRNGEAVSFDKQIPELEVREKTEKFMAAMEGYASVVAEELVHVFPLRGDEKLLDLGCGPGTYFRRYLTKYPNLTASAADVDDVVPIIEKHLVAENRREGVTLYRGDFREISFPANEYDVVLLSNVMHIYPPEEVTEIFHQVLEILRPGGTFLVNDFFTNDAGTRPVWGTLFSLNMLLNTVGGKNYRLQEGEALLEGAGFVGIYSKALPMDSTLLVGVKPG